MGLTDKLTKFKEKGKRLAFVGLVGSLGYLSGCAPISPEEQQRRDERLLMLGLGYGSIYEKNPQKATAMSLTSQIIRDYDVAREGRSEINIPGKSNAGSDNREKNLIYIELDEPVGGKDVGVSITPDVYITPCIWNDYDRDNLIGKEELVERKKKFRIDEKPMFFITSKSRKGFTIGCEVVDAYGSVFAKQMHLMSPVDKGFEASIGFLFNNLKEGPCFLKWYINGDHMLTMDIEIESVKTER